MKTYLLILCLALAGFRAAAFDLYLVEQANVYNASPTPLAIGYFGWVNLYGNPWLGPVYGCTVPPNSWVQVTSAINTHDVLAAGGYLQVVVGGIAHDVPNGGRIVFGTNVPPVWSEVTTNGVPVVRGRLAAIHAKVRQPDGSYQSKVVGFTARH